MDGEAKKIPESIRFHYIKSPQFATVHADGAIGGPTPGGRALHLAFYAERLPIPTSVEHKVEADGQLGPENTSARAARDGIVRELQVDVVMDLTTALSLRDWFDRNLKMIQDAIKTTDGEVH